LNRKAKVIDMKEVCKNCKHWFRNVYPNAELDEFEECEHPDMNES